MRLRIYVHPTCAVSYRLVKLLAEKGKLDEVELVDVSDPRVAIREGVLSVPFVVYEGVPAATDPLDPNEVLEMIEGRYEPRIDDPIGAVRDALIHSSFAAAVAVLNDRLEPALTYGLVAAAVRAPFTRIDPERVMQEVYARSDELWSTWRDLAARALGVSFVRETWWSLGGNLDPAFLRELVDKGAVRIWLIGKASVGRAGLPWKPQSVVERARPIEEFVRRGAVGLLKKVSREQLEIMNDSEYWNILDKKLVV